ncbi:MAG: hypothetical protein A3A81_04380 [Omnitrophica bacterium RIFCSPLOWO2_01_FULL_45_10b]|nr:MAG: hypothetical protein A3A81_04380 [Omnitrophica bacterium RIFCSPLOWO2_01_FULL_45_10b]
MQLYLLDKQEQVPAKHNLSPQIERRTQAKQEHAFSYCCEVYHTYKNFSISKERFKSANTFAHTAILIQFWWVQLFSQLLQNKKDKYG